MKTKQTIPLLLLLLLCSLGLGAQQLTADFKVDKTQGCAPAVISFEDRSTGNPTSWLWDFGNGNTSTLRNPATSYLRPGKYTVSLIVGNAAGNSDTIRREAYVNVYDNPKPNFFSNVAIGCSPVRVQFVDASVADTSNRIIEWEWDLGDGNLANTQNPGHVYRGTGDFAVTLKVTDDKGCSGLVQKAKFINVTPGVVPAFSNNQPRVCTAPANVTFNNTSSGPGSLSYTWLFGDGQTSTEKSPTHTYTYNDTFTVSLVVRSSAGCVDTLSRRGAAIVGGFKSDFAFRDSVCPGAVAQLVNNSKPLPLSSRWLFPDGTSSTQINPEKTFRSAGPVQIRLINTYANCNDTLIKTLTVSAPPQIRFTTADSVKCTPTLTSRFVNSTVGAVSYFWEFGDSTFSTEANPVHTYTELGRYDVRLTATSPAGCVSVLNKPDFIRIQTPQVRFNNLPQQGCIPYTATLEPRILGADSAVSYSWSFGDGQTSTEKRPIHVYDKVGNYTVSLTVTTATGCTATGTLGRAVRVGTKPKAAFSADPLDVCAAAGIRFNNESTGADEYLWQFGDGGTSKDQFPTYQFSDTGHIDVTLIAFSNGCGDTLLKPQYIHIKPPVSNFQIVPNCNNRFAFRFIDKSIDPETWEWEFSDGTKISGKDPGVHVFPAEGTYEIKLTTTKGECTSTRTSTIFIGKKSIDFEGTPLVVCKPARIQLAPVNSDLAGVKSLVWTYTSGSRTFVDSSAIEGVSSTLNLAGSYTVKLVTVDTFGCRRDSITKLDYIRVNGPEAEFDSPDRLTCTGRTVNFTDRSTTDGVNPITKWEWSYGLDNTDTVYTAPPFSKMYDSSGSFSVRLKVTDAAGCSDALIKRGFVRTSAIQMDFTSATQTCPNGTALQFNNTTSGTGNRYFWSFGDGSTSTQPSPRYTYKDTGHFTVTLRVSNTLGCTDSIVRPRYVYSGRPKASFEADNPASFCIPYEAKFRNTSTYFSSLLWNLGQGTSTLANPSAFYSVKGTYNIKLVVTSPGGCKDSVSMPIVVRDITDTRLSYTTKRECTPLQIDFEAFEDMKGRFVWDFGNGVVADTNTNKIAHVYTDFGSYLPSVILYEPSGCALTLKGSEAITPIGVEAKFAINQGIFCDEGMLRVSDSTVTNDDFVRYSWTFGDGGTSTQRNPVHFYDKAGTYLVQLIAQTASGCRDTSDQVPVTVSVSPRIAISGDTTVCERERRFYTGVLHNLDSASVQWRWALPNGGDTTTQTPGTQIFPTAGVYPISAIAFNADGCADTVVKYITVHPRPLVTVPPLFTIASGQQVLLPATYSSSVRKFFWSPPAGLSCTDCPQPTANPLKDTRYTINVVDSNGCQNSAETQIDVVCLEANVFVPNTFSPNGDGRNDVFFVRGAGLGRVRMLRVFNRWGEVVFERRESAINDPSVGWDGTYKGRKPQPDVYVYQAEVYCSTGEIIKLQGNVALIQ